jgi:transcriptional regulator with XRE-family HTH domain
MHYHCKGRKNPIKFRGEVFGMLNTGKISKLRKKMEITQAEAAKRIGIERTTYGKYESGVIQPPVDMVGRLADFFDVTVDYLLDRTDFPMYPDGKPPTKMEILADMTPEEIIYAAGVTDKTAAGMIMQMISYAKKTDAEIAN